MLAFLSGALLKVYDDFVDDERYITNEYIATILRYLQIVFVTLVLESDFLVSVLFTLFNGFCALSSFQEYSGPHVVAYFAIMPILLYTSWTKSTSITFTIYDFCVFLALCGMAILEPRLTPEETSWFKFALRFLSAYNCVFMILVYSPILSHSSLLIYELFMGYAIASSMAQLLKLTWLHPDPLQCAFERAWTQALGHIKPLHGAHPNDQ